MQYNKHYEIFKDEINQYSKWLEDYRNHIKHTTDLAAETEIYKKGGLLEIQFSFMTTYAKNIRSTADYFLGCAFVVYKARYRERCADFFSTFIDAGEIDFIRKELDAGILKIEYEILLLDEHISEQISYSLQKRFEFLQQRAEMNGYTLTYDYPNSKASNKEVYTIERIKKGLEPIKKGLEPDQKANKLPKWFPIGLGFATGDIQRKIKNRIKARRIAIEYELKDCHNYISLTIGIGQKDPKNIYSDRNKMMLVYNHCIENNIEICSHFLDAYKKICEDD